MNELERVNITFSSRCNLKCPFCICGKEAFSGDELPLDEWLKFIDELSANQVFNVGIWGGEPFLMPGLRRIIDRLVRGRMRFHLITNGSCVDGSLLEHIAATGRCNYLQFSLDGLEADHDAIRGAGVFRKALAAIQRAADLGIRVTVNSVISRKNRRNALEFAEFLESQNIHSYRLNLVNSQHLQLAPEYRPLSLPELADMIEEFMPHFDRLPHLHDASPVKRYWRQLQKPHPGESRFDFCQAPTAELAVRPNGAILPCGSADNIVLGIANRDRLAEVWNGTRLKAFRRRLRQGSKRNSARCLDCSYLYYCRKYCPGVSGKRYCRRELAEQLRSRGVLP